MGEIVWVLLIVAAFAALVSGIIACIVIALGYLVLLYDFCSSIFFSLMRFLRSQAVRVSRQ